MAINETAILASPILGPIAKLMQVASVVAGGIFGVYILLLILRWLEYKRFGKVLRDMREELRVLNDKINIIQGKLPEKRKSRTSKLIEKIKNRKKNSKKKTSKKKR